MSESTEHYLETILVLQNRIGEVRSIDIAKETGYSKPSVSEAIKKLKASELITVDSNGHILLTDLGMQKAKVIAERHEILTALFESFDVPTQVAEADACKIEHVISELTMEKIKLFLNK